MCAVVKDKWLIHEKCVVWCLVLGEVSTIVSIIIDELANKWISPISGLDDT